jgi:hypothetical protein
MTLDDILATNNLHPSSIKPGRYYTTCPRCSAERSREHQWLKVLGITIDDRGVTWGCNHCTWTGGAYYNGRGNGHDKSGFAAIYPYYDEGGELLFEVCRTWNKEFPQRKPNGRGGYDWKTKDVRKVLFRLPELMEAIANEQTVVVPEGEKDTLNLVRQGFAATCSPGGASEPSKKPKWIPEFSERLRGADIVIMPDHDEPGYAHADAIAKMSIGVAKRIRILMLAEHWPEIPKGGDVSHWLAAGHTGDELAALMEQAPDYAPAGQAKEARGEEPSAADAEIARLAKLTALQYEEARKCAAEQLDIRAAILDKLVTAERARPNPNDGSKQGQAIAFPDPEPWPDPVEGAALLDALAAAIRKHVVLPDHARDVCALWVVHTYLTDCFLISPRLGVRSPTKGCGKTLLLDVLDRVVARPLPTANVTAAAIFRVIEAHRPTLLVDEADTFLYDNDELRGVLYAGHRKGGAVLRTVGDDHEPRSFATYAPCVIALIGALPDTLHDRGGDRGSQAAALEREGRAVPSRPRQSPRRAGQKGGAVGKRSRRTNRYRRSGYAGGHRQPGGGQLEAAADDRRRGWW